MTLTPTAAVARSQVSVVIPVKDDVCALRRCLDALAAQTRAADEIIVVDNNSTDGSGRVARDAGARVVECREPGIPAAAAHGYDAARGDLILRLDADSVPAPSWIEAMCAAAASRPDIAAFSGGARFVDGPRALRGPLATLYLGAYLVVTGSALGHPPLFGSNLVMRTVAWRAIRSRTHRHDPRVHDDLDLAYHLGDRFRVGFVPLAAMGISMRPFGTVRGFVRRIEGGFRSVLLHWPRDFPPLRWMRLLLRRALIGSRPRAPGFAGAYRPRSARPDTPAARPSSRRPRASRRSAAAA